MKMVRRGTVRTETQTFLKKVIDKQCLAENEERKEERKAAGKGGRTLYASDYGQCMRKIFFQFFPDKYPQEEFDPRVLRIFHNGDAVHERLSRYLAREKDIKFMEEVDVPRDELEVHGRCDGMCLVEGRLVIVEFKSINRSVVYEPKEEHVGQLSWYMGMWTQERERLKKRLGLDPEAMVVWSVIEQQEWFANLTDVEKLLLQSYGPVMGELIYESKQTQATFHFQLEHEESRFKKVRFWFEQLKWHVENEKIPTVRFDKEKYPCSWKTGKCPYFDQCWSESIKS